MVRPRRGNIPPQTTGWRNELRDSHVLICCITVTSKSALPDAIGARSAGVRDSGSGVQPHFPRSKSTRKSLVSHGPVPQSAQFRKLVGVVLVTQYLLLDMYY